MKRITSLIVALIMSFTLLVPASAASSTAAQVSNVDISAKIQEEIKSETDRIFNTVYCQLEEQDALSLLDAYMNLYTLRIEENVYAKYNMSEKASRRLDYDTYTYDAPYGGVAAYTDYLGLEIVHTFLNRDDSYAFVLESHSFSVGDIIENILGYIPDIGGILGALLTMNSIADGIAMGNIYDAQGYAEITNMSDPYTGEEASVVTGWDNHETIKIYVGVGEDDPAVTIFPWHPSPLD